MSTPILSLQNVEKRFGKNHVLRGVSLDVEPGQSLVVIGGSGSGKSVMLKNALGLMTPNSGNILFNGEDVTQSKGKSRARMRERVGMLFQSGALFDSLTVWENVAFRLINADKTLKSAQELTPMLDQFLEPSVVTTCGSGVSAAVIALALARLGKWDAALYDGSWSEWAADTDNPIATAS